MASDTIREILKEILTTERTVLLLYEKIVNETESQEVKRVLNSIITDERKHVKNAEEALLILDSK